jgi:hypothetical protein
MFFSRLVGLLTFGLVFNYVTTNLVSRNIEDENSEYFHSFHICLSYNPLKCQLYYLPFTKLSRTSGKSRSEEESTRNKKNIKFPLYNITSHTLLMRIRIQRDMVEHIVIVSISPLTLMGICEWSTLNCEKFELFGKYYCCILHKFHLFSSFNDTKHERENLLVIMIFFLEKK